MTINIPTKNGKMFNSYGIPIVRGNLKYPTKYEANFQILNCKDVAERYRCKPSAARNCCMQCSESDIEETEVSADATRTCPAGIEVRLKSLYLLNIIL